MPGGRAYGLVTAMIVLQWSHDQKIPNCKRRSGTFRHCAGSVQGGALSIALSTLLHANMRPICTKAWPLRGCIFACARRQEVKKNLKLQRCHTYMFYKMVFTQSSPNPPLLGSPVGTLGSSPLLSAPIASDLLWGHSCMLVLKPHCVCP